MMKRVGLAASALAALWVSSASAGTAAPQLRVAPNQGHPGDTVYVSGAGFRPHTEVFVSYRCPSGNGSMYGGLGIQKVAHTDASGRFLGYAVQVPRPDAHLARCTFYGSAGQSVAPGRGGASAPFTVVAATTPLSPCAAHMCVKVHALLVRTRSGAWGHIAVHGWPGAEVDVTVVRTGPDKHRHVRLGWDGTAGIKMWIAPGLTKALHAQAEVRARLGRATGQATAAFSVIPGGR